MANNSVDYYIVSKPTEINFVCPHCDTEVYLPIESRFWEGCVEVECPECGGMVHLREWEYD